MALALFLIFIVVPFVELFVIIQVAGVIGGGWTILLLVVESILGAWLCKREGAGVLRRINEQLNAGQLPTIELVNGALILLAGALMVTPGFLTDILGFLLLIPPTRAIVRAIVLHRLQKRIDDAVSRDGDAGFGFIRVTNFGPNGSPFGFNGGSDDSVVDVASRDVTARSRADQPELGGGRP
ncbi:MAG: FxsA family protein [Actinobacteria bacterium]|nr:FxsA family protein [Actinomycetota bacterium]